MVKEDSSGRAISAISGDAIRISGDMVIAKVSGEVVKVSGEVVKISGETIIAKISGEAGYTPTLIFTGARQQLNDLSGGAALQSGIVMSVVVKAPATNSGDVYIGGNTGGNMPYSGYGLLLSPADSLAVDIDNPNKLKAMGAVSGYCYVHILGNV